MPFLTLSYWFQQLPVPFLPWALKVVLAVSGGFVVVGLALYAIARKKKDNLYWRDGIAHLAVAMFQTGLIALVLIWFTQQQIQFFGMRVWFAVLDLWFLARVVLIARRMMKVLPAKAAVVAEKARISKYLP